MSKIVGSLLRSSYIFFVSSQYVSDPINFRVFFVLLCLSVRRTQPHAYLSDANDDAPSNASVACDHFVGLFILTVCVETVGSRLCSSYIYFVSSQYVSDPINSIVFSCALLACETDPATCIPQR